MKSFAITVLFMVITLAGVVNAGSLPPNQNRCGDGFCDQTKENPQSCAMDCDAAFDCSVQGCGFSTGECMGNRLTLWKSSCISNRCRWKEFVSYCSCAIDHDGYAQCINQTCKVAADCPPVVSHCMPNNRIQLFEYECKNSRCLPKKSECRQCPPSTTCKRGPDQRVLCYAADNTIPDLPFAQFPLCNPGL